MQYILCPAGRDQHHHICFSSLQHWFYSHIRRDFQRAVITAGRQKYWPLDPIQKQQQNRSSYVICHYFSSHSVLNWSWWHLLKPSAGLQPYKSLKGGHVMSFQPETTHFICFHSNVCFLSAFGRELGGVYLLLAYSQCIRAKNRHSGRSAELLHQIVFTAVILETATCQSQIYRWIHLKQWIDPRQTIPRQRIGNYMPKTKKEWQNDCSIPVTIFNISYNV